MTDLLLQKIHGHLAILMVVALVHPVLLTLRARRISPGARRASLIATGLAVAANALGWWLYPAFREDVRPRLYEAGEHLGLMFEVKEHLAVVVLALAVAGGVAAWFCRGNAARELMPLVRRCYLGAFLLSLVPATFGVYIAATGGFADALT